MPRYCYGCGDPDHIVRLCPKIHPGSRRTSTAPGRGSAFPFRGRGREGPQFGSTVAARGGCVLGRGMSDVPIQQGVEIDHIRGVSGAPSHISPEMLEAEASGTITTGMT